MFKKRKTHARGLNRDLVTAVHPKSPISEQYRIIRTNIEFSAVDRQLQTLICTSAVPTEGKTTSASNLAIVFAQQGKKTLIVDADLRKPATHSAFKVANTVGLTSILTERTTVEKAVVPTTVEQLYILPSGPVPPNPAELLGSQSMKELIKELKECYDMILFDTPPVLAVTDPQLIGNLCDGALLVVKSNQTRKDDIMKAKELLQQANVHILGTVLNSKKQKNEQYYYGE